LANIGKPEAVYSAMRDSAESPFQIWCTTIASSLSCLDDAFLPNLDSFLNVVTEISQNPITEDRAALMDLFVSQTFPECVRKLLAMRPCRYDLARRIAAALKVIAGSLANMLPRFESPLPLHLLNCILAITDRTAAFYSLCHFSAVIEDFSVDDRVSVILQTLKRLPPSVPVFHFAVQFFAFLSPAFLNEEQTSQWLTLVSDPLAAFFESDFQAQLPDLEADFSAFFRIAVAVINSAGLKLIKDGLVSVGKAFALADRADLQTSAAKIVDSFLTVFAEYPAAVQMDYRGEIAEIVITDDFLSYITAPETHPFLHLPILLMAHHLILLWHRVSVLEWRASDPLLSLLSSGIVLLEQSDQTSVVREILNIPNPTATHIVQFQQLAVNLSRPAPEVASIIIDHLLLQCSANGMVVHAVFASKRPSTDATTLFIERLILFALSRPHRIDFAWIFDDVFRPEHKDKVDGWVDKLAENPSAESCAVFCHLFPRSTREMTSAMLGHFWQYISSDDLLLAEFDQILRDRKLAAFTPDCFAFLRSLIPKCPPGSASPAFASLVLDLFVLEAHLLQQSPLRPKAKLNGVALPAEFSLQSLDLPLFRPLIAVYALAENPATVERLLKPLLVLFHRLRPGLETFFFDRLLDHAGGEQPAIRIVQICSAIVGTHPGPIRLADIGRNSHRPRSTKQLIKICIAGPDKTVEILERPAMSVELLQVRLEYIFQAVPRSLRLVGHFRDLKGDDTLEEAQIGQNASLRAVYDPSPQPIPAEPLLETVLAGSAAAVTALKLLRTCSDSRQLGVRALHFLGLIETPVEVLSLYDAVDVAAQTIRDSANPFELEYYLQGAVNRLGDPGFRARFAAAIHGDFCSLMARAGVRGQRLLLQLCDVATFDATGQVGWVISCYFQNRSAKLATSAEEAIKGILDSRPGLMNQYLVSDTKHFASVWSESGDFFGLFNGREGVFDGFFPLIRQYLSNSAIFPPLFRSVVAAIRNSSHESLVGEFCGAQLQSSPPDYALASIGVFLRQFKTWQSRMDISLLAPYLLDEDSDAEAHIALLADLPQRGPPLARFLSQYTAGSVPGFGVDPSEPLSDVVVGLWPSHHLACANSVFQLLRCSPFIFSVVNDPELTEPWQVELRRLSATLLAHEIWCGDAATVCAHFPPNRRGGPMAPADPMDFIQAIFDRLPPSSTKAFRGVLSRSEDGISTAYHAEMPEPFIAIHVPVAGLRSLPQSLSAAFADRVVRDFSYNGSPPFEVVHRTTFAEAPDILLVHLQRFVTEPMSNRVTIHGHQFAFPVTLDLSQLNAGEYRLIGAIGQRGKASACEYVTFGLVPELDRWFRFNDQEVSPVTVASMARAFCGLDDDPFDVFACVLCYSRVEIAPVPLSPEAEAMVVADRQQMVKIKVAASDHFFNLALTLEDPLFLVVYLGHILNHLKRPDRCEAVRERLMQIFVTKPGLPTLARLLSGNSGVVCGVYRAGTDLGILASWTALLKYVVISQPNLVADLIEGLAHLAARLTVLHLESIEKCKMIVDIAKTYAECGHEYAQAVRAMGWVETIAITLDLYYRHTPHTEFGTADFSGLFDCLMACLPLDNEDIAKRLHTLSRSIVMSPAHIDAFFNLMQHVASE
jgi:hypothetical protein